MIFDSGIVLENESFRLTLSENCAAESLILKSSGEECLFKSKKVPFFAIVEERPFNNEIKLAHPIRRMTFNANRVRMENGRLIVGFEKLGFEAIVDVNIAPLYINFELVDFIVTPDSFGVGTTPMLPPVAEFNLVQLPITDRESFGEWLNVVFDGKVAINLLSTSPYAYTYADEKEGHRVLIGKALRDTKLKNAGVALIVTERERLLDVIDTVEKDFDLPHGVESRQTPLINRSYYWSSNINPENLDRHIEYAKKGGFRLMTVYYTCIFTELGAFKSVGDYRAFRKEYPNGLQDVKKMVERIKAAGLTPGLHVLATHIGLRTPFLTPKADHRLSLVKHFTLARPISEGDTDIYVEENPEGSPEYEKARVLSFMGELINYESFTTERPYCFKGCTRGFNDTVPRAHEIGTIGGILDISEYCANSAYIDQRTSLQDEIADQIAELYDQGFEYLYFDGAEGTTPPFDVTVGLAQWRVYKKLKKAPLFCEGAAKSHFSWHILSGGNAFDVWPPECFKEMLRMHPLAEAPRIKQDFTRLNFGWWKLRSGQRPDIMEYGTALAAACDCPGSFSADLRTLDTLPRTDDILEVMKRWEDARATGFLTAELKERIKDTSVEHTLLIDENGDFELADCEHITDAFGGDARATAFVFERKGKLCASFWHNGGSDSFILPLACEDVRLLTDFGKDELTVNKTDEGLILPIDRKRYLVTGATKEELVTALRNARLKN